MLDPDSFGHDDAILKDMAFWNSKGKNPLGQSGGHVKLPGT